MNIDFTPYFKKYEALVATSDEAFDRVKKAHADCVKCEERCSDCCHALFDLTLIETLYLNYKFKEKFAGSKRAELLEKANRADRRAYQIKRKAYKKLKSKIIPMGCYFLAGTSSLMISSRVKPLKPLKPNVKRTGRIFSLLWAFSRAVTMSRTSFSVNFPFW